MIEWLVQSAASHPDLARGVAPAGLLGEQEQARLAALKTEKRRCDWLLGRWTAKHLLQFYVERRTGLRPPLDTLIVDTDPDGAPRVVGDWRLEIGDRGSHFQSLISNLQSLTLSISHRDGHAFCAVAATEGARLGADIERIEPRSWQFVEDYFTGDEIALVRQAPAAEHDSLVTAIWSAKEAVLKALRLGLTVDTRSVSCTLDTPARPDGWAAFGVRCEPRLLGTGDVPDLAGWWRTVDCYILTLAMTGDIERPRDKQIARPGGAAIAP